MIKNHYNVIGVMSGTSLDGIDLAQCKFTNADGWTFEICHAETYPYPEHWVEKLKTLVMYSKSELEELNKEYTAFLGQIISHFISKYQLDSVDAVCSHGHTALHQPQHGMTYQIGNLPVLATLINQTLVCDFRVEDVALGGQGAPLVPIGDQLLFSEYDFCLNLGGFANISFSDKGQRIAYDICPANIVLNHYVADLGLAYDHGGSIAESGKVDVNLLDQLNALPYYQLGYPKSLGLEWVKSDIFPVIDARQLVTEDILRTFVEHMAIQISKVINFQKGELLLTTGGGAFHKFFMTRLKEHSKHQIIIPESKIIEFKEALIFAFLGVLKLRNENNCLSSVTGAVRDHCSGKIYYS